MTWVSRRALAPLVGAIALGSVLSACSDSSVDGAVATAGQSEFITIDTKSPPFVTVENRSGQPLLDVNVTLKSGILTFSDSISRLETNEKRQMRHNDFASRDGTTFSLRLTTPRDVLVSAKGMDGKAFETSTRW
jgi:hypothetical protein